MATTNLDALSLSTGLPTASIADNAVTTAKIADVNVTTGKIADLGVTTGKIADLGVTTGKIADLGVTTGKLAAALQTNQRSHQMPTIATTGTTEVLFRAPVTGTVTAAAFVGKDALTQHATNIITWAIVNKGAANGGTTAVLAVSDANSTKTSTGTALGAYVPFPLTLHGTPSNLAVVKGDILVFQAVAGGTLANTVTEGLAVIEFTPS